MENEISDKECTLTALDKFVSELAATSPEGLEYIAQDFKNLLKTIRELRSDSLGAVFAALLSLTLFKAPATDKVENYIMCELGIRAVKKGMSPLSGILNKDGEKVPLSEILSL